MENLLARTARIATVSQFSQSELAKSLRIPAGDILLAPNGADHFRSIQPDYAIVPRLQVEPGKYFVTLGLSSANKNIGVAIEAFHRLNRGDAKLIIVGEGSSRVTSAQSFEPRPGVIFAGRLSDEEVAALLRCATALVFPSRYEGFGIPPLEAMAQGCPVIASTAGAVMEVCGDAALHFHPDDVPALTNLMRKVLDEPRAAVTSRGRGFRRSDQYRWATAATRLMQCLQEMRSAEQRTNVVPIYQYHKHLPTR
jgi:glycosyltransferase involved in cell wall biosynthesis